ncbi:hypothetical protein IQ273_24765 [Nodosilinea sp. LEGE 07298]|uniref:hypothetical protein n=1 Tax=Nodosilinea sp. LEGE 07298 TaxID=2777970 RepID=UPI00187F18DE|nr:hypothetical protein [Nodosilinea sp. LEGE 07298]MBE9112608.1 hypothetical protein [Nodosilinea sp. LEGE 07298]
MNQSPDFLEGNHLNEEAILTCCALRFDGFKYAEEHGFKPDELVQQYLQTGQWHGTELELLAAFFHLQRALFKWSLVYETWESPYWRAFRELFLQLYAAEIPAQYQMTEYFDEWIRDFQPRLDQCVAVVREKHETTTYADVV